MRDTYPVMNKSPLRPYLIGLEYRFVRHGSRARFGIVAIVCLPRPRSGLQGLVGQPSGGSVERVVGPVARPAGDGSGICRSWN